MKKIFKNPVFTFILGAILFGTIGVTASVLYNASEIGFTSTDPNWKVNNLNDAINDLYKGKSTAVQVATLTTPGATYTMQNDGYITGTVRKDSGQRAANVYFDSINDNNLVYYGFVNGIDMKVSLYVSKNTQVLTRTDGGLYNLTVYEWK